MKKLLNRLRLALAVRSAEQGLMTFCELEYPKCDSVYAYNKIMSSYKTNYLRKGIY